MTDATRTDRSGGLTEWVAAAMVAFGVVGTVDWARAAFASTHAEPGGVVAALVVFASLWIAGGAVWGLATAGALWVAVGRVSGAEPMQRIFGAAQRWYNERHTDADSDRLANLVTICAAVVAFGAASVAWTTYLIESANLAWLIAAASLGGQLGIAAVVVVVALGVRRLVCAAVKRLRGDGRLQWLNFPFVALAVAAAAIIAAVAACVVGRDVYMAVEGPALTLLVVGLVLHPPLAWLSARFVAFAPSVRYGLWAVPLVAVALVVTASQHSEARRILVLHGDGANFAFNQLHRHVELDRFFDRGDCPIPDYDGTAPDGISEQEFAERCLDPVYRRPFAREEVPDYEHPDFEQRPSFVFVTWDSVRVDRLGFMDHYRDTTPNLDEFAEDNLVFERAFTQDSGTGPSFWSLMAGKTPFQVSLKHGHRFPPPIDPDEQMLGEILDDEGYRNEAVMCGRVFDTEDWGIGWGFDRFENVCGDQLSELAPIVTAEATDTVERLAAEDEPFFVWVHYYDPHHPYNDHPDIGYGDGRLERYDEELTYTDEHFGELLGLIDELRDDYDRPLFTIFGADHGENFDEHGTDPHARNLYRIVTHIPKIIDGPGVEARRVDPPVAFNDVFPTVLDLAGIDIPEDTTMVSQVPVLYGAEADEDRMVFQENSYSRPRRHTRGVVYDRFHYIMDLTTGTEELYDYVDDPIERVNLIGTGLDAEPILRQAIIRFLETSEIPEGLED